MLRVDCAGAFAQTQTVAKDLGAADAWDIDESRRAIEVEETRFELLIGAQFVDLTDAYAPRLRELLRNLLGSILVPYMK